MAIHPVACLSRRPCRRFFHKTVLTLVVVLAGLAISVQAADLTFDQALTMMLSANEFVQAAHSESEQRAYESAVAQGLYYPKITLTGRVTQLDDPIDLDLNSIRDAMLALHPAVPASAVPSFEETIQDDTFWKSQLNMVWPVFTGGRIRAANAAAEAGTREADAKLRRTTETLTSDLVRTYFAVRLADQVVGIRAEAKGALDRHLFEARRMYAEGFIAQTELLHAQVAQAQADRELKASRRDLALAYTALANVLSSDEPVTPTTPLFLVSELEPVENFVRQALDRHPALDQLDAIKDKTHENLRAEKAAYAPEVYLFGMRELYEHDLTILEPAWAVGVGLNFTLFDGFARPNRIHAAQKLEEQAGLRRQKLARDLETLVSSTYQELMKAREQFDALQTSLNFTDENLRARRRAFEEGLATSLDVVDAQLSLSSVRVERLRAAYDFDVALAQLLEASGQGKDFPGYLAGAYMEVER
jgi:outer membrane protein TolC